MTHLAPLVAAAALVGGIAACQPSAAEHARWRERCENLRDVAAHAEWSRNGVSASCNATTLGRSALR